MAVSPRVITLKASDVAGILTQVLDGQNEVLARYDASEKRATALEHHNALLEKRLATTEENVRVLMEAVAERRRMFRAIAKESFFGLMKILGVVLVLLFLGFSFHDALMKAVHP